MKLFRCIVVLVLVVMFSSFGLGKTSLSGEVIARDNPGDFQEARFYRVYFTDLDMAHKIVISMDAIETKYETGYIIVRASNEQEYNRLLDTGSQLEEICNPLEDTIAAIQNAALYQIESIPGYTCYRTVEETYASAASIASNYPTLATWTDYGDSWDKANGFGGYDLMVLKLTNSAIEGTKPKVFITGAMHAREYATAELLTRLAEYLATNYGTNADATWMLDYHEVHFMLQSNPDGRKKAETGLSWRKNTNQNYCGATSNDRGADLNRNFAFKWACCGGSSSVACDPTYHGPSAASEPETQIIQDYIASQFPDQRGPLDTDAAPLDTPGVYIDVHASGRLLLWSWGWTYSLAPNATQLQTFGRKMAYFNSHTPEAITGLYVTDGTSIDHAYGELGIASFGYEIGTAFFEGCSYFENTLIPANFPALLYGIKAARTPYITPAGPDAVNVALSNGSTPAGVPAGSVVPLSATINDTRYNNSNGTESTQNIAAAEYYVDTPAWVTSPTPVAIAMLASDGTFNSTIEAVGAAIDTTGWSVGKHIIFVRGQDVNGNWGAFSAIFLYINESTLQAPAAEFTASATTITSGQSVTFTDQSSNFPTTWSWTFTGGAPSSSSLQNPVITYGAPGTYTVSLTAANAAGNDTNTKTNYITVNPAAYCSSASTNCTREWIASVKFGSVTKTSGASNYSDFTSTVFNMTRGAGVSFTLTPAFNGSSRTEYWRVWIDYNKDGDFADTGEQVYSGSGKTAKTGSFTVPSSASTGNTRLRVSMKYSAYPTPCETFTYGEVEDYTANIL